VSYASKDKARVLPIVARLRALGLTVFIDEVQIDGAGVDQTPRVIGKSQAILFFASGASYQSSQTIMELALARRKQKGIVPVFLDEVETPDAFASFLPEQQVRLRALGEFDPLPEIFKKLQESGVQPQPPSAPAFVEAPEPAGADIPINRVAFSVFAPPAVRPQSSFVLSVWAILHESDRSVDAEVPRRQREEMLRRASAGGKLVETGTRGPILIPASSDLTLTIDVPGFEIAEPVDTLLWEGEIANVSFVVRAPDLAPGTYPGTVRVLRYGLLLTRVVFAIEVANGVPAEPPAPIVVRTEQRNVRSAFASYASDDRADVLARVQGIRAAGIDVFIDVLALRAGDRWEIELERAIDERDVFYLFWSAAARSSEWVDREWRMALGARGPDFIWPVPLADPRDVPPPPELAHKHFNDELLPHIEGEWRRHATAQPVAFLSASAPAFIGAAPLVPYLIERQQQAHEVMDAFSLHSQSYPRRPLVFFVHANPDQALDEYVERFQQHELPKVLGHMRSEGYRDIIRRVDLRWPDGDWGSNPTRTFEHLKADLLNQFNLTSSDWPLGLAAELLKAHAVPLICYQLAWEDWDDRKLRTLKAWVREWAAMPDLPPGSPIVVVFAIQQNRASKGARFPFVRRAKSPIIEIARFGELTSKDLLVIPLTELGNVYMADVDDWIRSVVKPRDPAKMVKRFREVLDDPALFGPEGISMTRFVDLMHRTGALDMLTTWEP
jgi:hypothetical protein